MRSICLLVPGSLGNAIFIIHHFCYISSLHFNEMIGVGHSLSFGFVLQIEFGQSQFENYSVRTNAVILKAEVIVVKKSTHTEELS